MHATNCMFLCAFFFSGLSIQLKNRNRRLNIKKTTHSPDIWYFIYFIILKKNHANSLLILPGILNGYKDVCLVWLVGGKCGHVPNNQGSSHQLEFGCLFLLNFLLKNCLVPPRLVSFLLLNGYDYWQVILHTNVVTYKYTSLVILYY